MKNIYLLTIFSLAIIIFSLSQVSSTDDNPPYGFIVTQGVNYDLRIPCILDGSTCSATATCNLTILDNGTAAIKNRPLTNQIQYHNITLNTTFTSLSGEFNSLVTCCDAGICGSSTPTILINAPGVRPTDNRSQSLTRMIYFTIIFAVLMLGGFFFSKKPPVKVTFLIVGAIFFLISINLIGITLRDETVNPRIVTFFDKFTAISFIFYWFGGVAIFVIWVFTFINTILHNSVKKKREAFGYQ